MQKVIKDARAEVTCQKYSEASLKEFLPAKCRVFQYQKIITLTNYNPLNKTGIYEGIEM